jgi:2-oxoglutarate ferredoxin oxidoreductase subunit delta
MTGKQIGKKNAVKIGINTEWCKGCGICAAFCPEHVLELNSKDKSEVVRLENCIACLMCELRCPDLAIEVIAFPASQTESADDNPNR